MAKTRAKTISYRRAVWLTDDQSGDLEQLLRSAHKTLKTVSQRKFKRADGQYIKSITSLTRKPGGFFMHIVAETPGDHASTLSSQHEAEEHGEVGTAPPPAGNEFMDGDIFVFVNGNDVCICSTVLREAAVTVFCQQLFEKAGMDDSALMFDLQKAANVNKIKLINTEGVKEIDLQATLYSATVDYIKRKTETAGVLGAVGKHISALLGDDKAPTADNIKVGVTLRTDHRMKDGKVIGEKRMKKLAKELVEGDDEYIIVTRSGQRISQNEVFIRERVEIERHGKSVERNSAWHALEKFHIRLTEAGVADE